MCQSSRMISWILSRVRVSRLAMGSSMRKTLGRSARARAIPTRRRIPSESSEGYLFSKPANPRALRISLTPSRGNPWSLRASSAFCRTVFQGKSPASWVIKATSFLTPLTSSPRTRILPPDGFISPSMAKSRDVFPHPDGPITETSSPSPTSKLNPSTASVRRRPRPYSIRRSRTEIIPRTRPSRPPRRGART